MNDRLTVALCGGGTGGHVMPSLAVGRELKVLRPDAEFIYIGAGNSIEERLAASENIPFKQVSIKPLRRGVILPNLLVPWLAVSSIFEAIKILKSTRASLVFGSGGFSSWPATAAARFSKRPYFLSEGNAKPGLVVRLLSGKARRIYTAFRETGNYLGLPSEKIMLTGYPVSSRIGKEDKVAARLRLGLDPGRKTVLVTGGSQGARSINRAVAEAKRQLLEMGFNLIWQTGRNWEGDNRVADLSDRVIIEPFLEPSKMASAISSADVAVTRCGMMTLSELAVAGVPAIMIPYPYAAEAHQEANARAIEASGGGKLILDSDLKSDVLVQAIEMVMEPESHQIRATNMKKLAHPDAAREIALDILRTLNA